MLNFVEHACFYVGVELSSRAVSSQVLSPLTSLTTVFGMGTGVPSSPLTRTYFSLKRKAKQKKLYCFWCSIHLKVYTFKTEQPQAFKNNPVDYF